MLGPYPESGSCSGDAESAHYSRTTLALKLRTLDMEETAAFIPGLVLTPLSFNHISSICLYPSDLLPVIYSRFTLTTDPLTLGMYSGRWHICDEIDPPGAISALAEIFFP